MSIQISNPKFQIDDNNGVPLAAGKVYTYVVGTTTLATTFSDIALTPNANPVILNERGECVIYSNQTLKLKVTDSEDNTIWTMDNIGVQFIGDFYLCNYASLSAAITAIGSTPGILHITSGTWPVSANLTVPATLTLKADGGILAVATGVTLTVNGPLDAGASQVFSCTGTGTVAFAKVGKVYPEWFGAAGDGTTDDTAALNLSRDACPTKGAVYLTPTRTYKTTGWLIQKDIAVISDSMPTSYIGSATSLKAAGSQAYVLKFLGNHNYADSFGYVRANIRNISINGNLSGGAVISDAALIFETCFNSLAENFTVQDVTGHAIRLRNVHEIRFLNYFILNSGSIDTGSAWYIDGPAPFDANYVTSNINIGNGTWSANRGRWLHVSSLAGIDGFWLENNKFEVDATTPNTVPTSVVYLEATSRTWITKNTFANFGMATNNYRDLIYINGDPANTSYGASDIMVTNNSAANVAGAGAINGLYLDTKCPTVLEKDNVFRTGDAAGCPNYNVSQFPQLIGNYWRTVSGSLFALIMPSREWPGFISAHKVTRSTSSAPFIVDATCANDAGTVLKLAAANQALPEVCALQDLSRWVGHTATNLLVKVRMRLDAAGSVTVKGVPDFPASDQVNVTVNSTSWRYYTFTFPIVNLTSVNHFLNIYLWTIDSGTPSLLVDGMEFSTS